MAAGLALGFGAGAFAAALTSLTPGVFTSDVALHPTMRSLAPQVDPDLTRGHESGLMSWQLCMVQSVASPQVFATRHCRCWVR